MFCLKDGPSSLVFQHIAVLLTHCCGGDSQVVGPPPQIVALVGEDVILPCHLEPAEDAVPMILEWGRPDLKPRFVHVWNKGQNHLVNQNPSYKGRTSLSTDKLKHGDLSLKLSEVKLSDGGTYRCYVPKLSRESTVQLIVGSVSTPFITGVNISSDAGVLQCESKGWYPEPEVSWLDSEGHVLSAGPTETVRGPDGLYTVSSRLTVEKRHSDSFTCRVQQKNINQIRETQIQISAEFTEAMSSSSSAACISIVLVVFLIFILAAAFFGRKLLNRKNQTPDTNTEAEEREREREQLLADKKKMEDLDEKVKLEGRLEAKEEEQKDLEETVKMLTIQRNDLEKQKDQLQHHRDDIKKNLDDIKNKMKSVQEKAEKNPAQSQEYDMKDIILTAKERLRDRKQEAEQFHQSTQTLLNKTTSLLNTMTDRKKDVEKQREKIRDQLEEIQRKLQSEQKQET